MSVYSLAVWRARFRLFWLCFFGNTPLNHLRLRMCRAILADLLKDRTNTMTVLSKEIQT